MPDETTPEPARRPRALRVTVLVIVLLLIAAAGALGWATLGTDWQARRQASALVDETTSRWANGSANTSPAGEGDVVAVLTADRLGLTWPVVAGTSPGALDRGVGWYPHTALPGEKGNVALAGRRITHGSPFRHLLDLAVGDTLTLRTAAGSFTYRVVSPAAEVDAGPSGAWVLDPVPGTNRAPTTSLLTLTTAADLVATSRRAVVFAELVG